VKFCIVRISKPLVVLVSRATV